MLSSCLYCSSGRFRFLFWLPGATDMMSCAFGKVHGVVNHTSGAFVQGPDGFVHVSCAFGKASGRVNQTSCAFGKAPGAVNRRPSHLKKHPGQ